MTMVAIATKGARAIVVTDSISYGPHLRTLGTATKTAPLLHLDGMIAGQGHGALTAHMKAALLVQDPVRDFRDLLAAAPTVLRDVDSMVTVGDPMPTSIFLVGPGADGQFEAWEFSSRRDWEPLRLPSMFCYPMPWNHAPGETELLEAGATSHPKREEIIDLWTQKPSIAAPMDTPDWIDLAKHVRHTRAETSTWPVGIGGRVWMHVISRGKIRSQIIHEYDDRPESPSFQAMVAGSMHPLGQALPCVCGSGVRLRDCCLLLEDPCPCQSEKTIEECCAIE